MFVNSAILSVIRLSFITVLVLLTGSISAQTDRRDDLTTIIKQHAVWDPAEFILDKLTTNRIFMMGDEVHGDPLFSKEVVNSLNKWISKCEDSTLKTISKQLPSKLLLVLEIDSVQASALNRFCQTGNPTETIQLAYWGQYTTATLEFYDDLRRITHQVEDFNRRHDQDSHISFEIIGPEKVIDLRNWTTTRSDSFFVFERDEYSSARIKELLERTPATKALIFYGPAHLGREKANKGTMTKLPMGYFLAHYLTESFGSNGGVYTCDQVDVQASSWIDQAVAKVCKTFASDNSILAGVPIALDASFTPDDGAIYHFVQPRHVRPISTVFSENLVDYILANIDVYRDSTQGWYKWILDTWLRYLSDVTATYWHPLDHSNAFAVDSTIKAWKDWRKSTKLDIVEDVSSLQYFKRSVHRIRTTSDPQSTQYQMQLGTLTGFKVWFQNGASPEVRADSIWMYINKYRKPIVVKNLIDLLWVGSNSEDQKALTILKKETGQDFNTAKEWTSWWETQQTN